MWMIEIMAGVRRRMAFSLLVLAVSFEASLAMQTPNVARQVAVTGPLRVSFLGSNPMQGRVDAQTGAVSGPVKELADELARRLGVPVTFAPLVGVPAVLESLKTGTADVGFLAIDSTRATQVDFSQPYLLGWSSYIVAASSTLRSVKDVDRAGVRVAVNTGDSPGLFLSRNLKAATLTHASGLADVLEPLANGSLDAFAANRQRLVEAVAADRRFRVLEDNFFAVEQAIAVPKGRAAALDVVNAFLDDAKASGLVQGAIQRAGLTGTAAVAPPRVR